MILRVDFRIFHESLHLAQSGEERELIFRSAASNRAAVVNNVGVKRLRMCGRCGGQTSYFMAVRAVLTNRILRNNPKG